MTESEKPAPNERNHAPAEPGERTAMIGRRLRQIFDEVAAEPIPDAFKDLLGKLE